MIGTDLTTARQILENNQLVAIPTETVYGLAGNAFSDIAVAEIFRVKNRPTFDPLIVHTYSIDKIHDFVIEFPEKAKKLAETFMPGALTLLLPKKNNIPDLVTSGIDTVAIRIPNHPLTLELLKILPFPLAAPSANPFGYISPTSALHVEKQLGNKIPYILDGGSAAIGIESTIVGFERKNPIIFRLGGISVEEIENVIGKVKVMSHSTSNPQAPGMLKSHYAPRKPLLLENLDLLIEKYGADKIGYLGFQENNIKIPAKSQIVLSTKGDFSEAARNLFASMRKLDEMEIEIIFAELLPEKDLGRAINDRIKRASIKD